MVESKTISESGSKMRDMARDICYTNRVVNKLFLTINYLRSVGVRRVDEHKLANIGET